MFALQKVHPIWMLAISDAGSLDDAGVVDLKYSQVSPYSTNKQHSSVGTFWT